MSKNTDTSADTLAINRRSTYVEPDADEQAETETAETSAFDGGTIPKFLEEDERDEPEKEQGETLPPAEELIGAEPLRETPIERALPEREQVLDDASALISVERAADYGPAQESFGRIAHIWSAILGVTVTEKQAAMMLAGLKLSRLAYQPDHRDSWVDLAGYAALGSEMVTREPNARY